MVGKLNELLDEIHQAIELADQELLKRENLQEVERKSKQELKVLSDKFDEIWKLRYEKLTKPGWRHVIREDFLGRNVAIEFLGPIQEFITGLLEAQAGSKIKKEEYIPVGRPYDARQLLRQIFQLANDEIVVIDNFLHPNILAVLETYINDVPILQVRLLTRSQNNSNFKSFISDLQLLAQQYPSRLIEAKENNKCHGRFIIVDRKVVYHSGHSFHDLGKKADHINKIENTDEVQKVITDFENWWRNGSSIK